MELFNHNEIDQVHLIYTLYHSMLSQEAVSVQLLPLDYIDWKEHEDIRTSWAPATDET
jgi:F0F1-type ATP synthase gamma subunit